MYLSVGPVLVIAIFLAAPVLWATWWFFAELGETASGRPYPRPAVLKR